MGWKESRVNQKWLQAKWALVVQPVATQCLVGQGDAAVGRRTEQPPLPLVAWNKYREEVIAKDFHRQLLWRDVPLAGSRGQGGFELWG